MNGQDIFMNVPVGETCQTLVEGKVETIRRIQPMVLEGVTYNARIVIGRHLRLYITGKQAVTI